MKLIYKGRNLINLRDNKLRHIHFKIVKFNSNKHSDFEYLTSKSKILTIDFDENNQRQIKLENYESARPTKEKTSNIDRRNFSQILSKVKIFGSENLDSNKEDLVQDRNAQKEEVRENLKKDTSVFSDYSRIYIKAGDGGNGSMSFIKGPLFNDRTPQGGDGGKGGDIILQADEAVSSLSILRKAHFLGNNGENGQSKGKGGKIGKDIIIHLPVGTVVNEILRDDDYKFAKKELRTEKDVRTKQLVDLDQHGKKFIICQGGKAGIGNVTKRNISKDSTQLKGKLGEEKELELVLKCNADIGLVGYPNSGKSTLLAALTRAMPKIAPYPFTTLHPHTGKLKFNQAFTLTIADLPGIIEGAHMNKGLGHKFLKHIERTKIIIFLLDGSLDPYDKRSSLNDLMSLFNEVYLYNKNYMNKPYLIVLNKCDINEENYSANCEIIKNYERIKGNDIIEISAKEGRGLDVLVAKIRQLSDKILAELKQN